MTCNCHSYPCACRGFKTYVGDVFPPLNYVGDFPPNRIVWDKDRFPQLNDPQPFQPFVQQGWECPKCGHVYAPTVTECRDCNRPQFEAKGIPTSDTTAFVLTEEDGKLTVRKITLEE